MMGPKKAKNRRESNAEWAAHCLTGQCLDSQLGISRHARCYTLTCNLNCSISFHASCWRHFKESKNLKTEKDGLDLPCVTPDCPGSVVGIQVKKENGQVVNIEKSAFQTKTAAQTKTASQTPMEVEKKKMPPVAATSGPSGEPSKKRTESECDANLKQNHETQLIKELKLKLKNQSTELREANALIAKQSKDLEKLHQESKKLLALKTQADENVAHLTETVHGLELNQEQVINEIHLKYKPIVKKLVNEKDLLIQKAELRTLELTKLREDIYNMKQTNDNLSQCNNYRISAGVENTTLKSKLLRAQANQSRQKVETEISNVSNHILALKSLLLWFNPKKIPLKSRKDGTWNEFRAILVKHCDQYDHYKKELEKFLIRCEDAHAHFLATLKKTGNVPDFSMEPAIKRPQLKDMNFIEDVSTILQEYITTEIVKANSTNANSTNATASDEKELPSSEKSGSTTSLKSCSSTVASIPRIPPSFALLMGDVRRSFPKLKSEEVQKYIFKVMPQNEETPRALKISEIVRLVGQTLPLGDWNFNSRVCIDWNIEDFDVNGSDECCICLDLLTMKTRTKLEPCGHQFHNDCIKMWFKEKRDCPFCRNFTVLDDEYPAVDSSNSIF